MTSPQDWDTKLLEQGGVGALLIQKKEEILERFCQRAQDSLPNARPEPHPVIVNTLPAFITRVAMALAGSGGVEYATMYSNMGYAHGDERARFTAYSLKELLAEYRFLREIIVDVLRRHASPSADEWHRLHRSVDEAMAEAATAFIEVHDRFREMFAASLTHDFRGPLANVRNFLELMRRETAASEREQFALRALRNLDRVGRMIAGLLDASRTNAGERLGLDAAECDVRGLLDEAVGDLDSSLSERVTIDMPAEATAFWDREKIRRTVYNLLDNALKYSPVGSTVAVRAVETHRRIHVSVHNSGEPIPQEDLRTLFQPFQRSSVAQRSGKSGWGLGLTLVHAVAEAHGGAVEVESSAANGTTFTLDLVRDVRDLRKD
jgi:signal transduction histidine kinase